MNEHPNEIVRTPLWHHIYAIVSKIPRKDVEYDAADAVSVSTDIEKLFNQHSLYIDTKTPTENEIISDKIIDRLATLLKEDFSGSNDYLSGVNDGVYKALHHCMDKKITLPVSDVRQKAKEFIEKMSKEPSMLSTESMLVKFYCDMNGTVKRITNDL